MRKSSSKETNEENNNFFLNEKVSINSFKKKQKNSNLLNSMQKPNTFSR